MGCRGCKEKRERFKKMTAKTAKTAKQYTKEEIHFMSVCPHGVPNGYKCKTCKKVIEIPADAKLQPVESEVKQD